MPVFGERNITSITIKVNQLSTPQEDDSDKPIELYLSDLIHLIQIQPTTGASEAARAIRKKIKYGESVKVQLKALSVLELLVLNSGPKIGPTIARDDKLHDVLKGIINGNGKTGSGTSYHIDVQRKVRGLARGWKSELADMSDYKPLATLWKAIPGVKHGRTHSRNTSENVFGSEIDDQPNSPRPPSHKKVPPPRPAKSSPYSATNEEPKNTKGKKKKRRRKTRGVRYADEEYQIPQINYNVESPRIRTVIADCHTHTTTLNNLLMSLPSGISPLDDEKCSSEFDKCRSIRRKVLRYLQYVGAGDTTTKSDEVLAMDEEFLGSLIVANEQLVDAFKNFDKACGYTAENPAPNYDDDDVDSEGYESYYTDESSNSDTEQVTNDLSNVNLAEEGPSSALQGKKSPPPIPKTKPTGYTNKNLTKVETNASVSSDPFGDKNEV